MHARTNMAVIAEFLPVRFEVQSEEAFTRVCVASTADSGPGQ
jgi:RNA 3'-terminal phosphate cyclase